MNIALTGFKGCGKTTIGKALAQKTGKRFIDLDDIITELYEKENGKRLSCREIHKKHGAEFFRALEARAVKEATKKNNCVLALGGGTLTNKKSAELLKKNFKIVYLKESTENLLKRIKENGIPAFLDPNDLEGSMKRELAKREPVYEKYADIKINAANKPIQGTVEAILNVLK